ncbi:hypothetical protein WJX72_005028 [[Myrmecia] bisecta]|uniref:Long-chain-fatty-acid--CoA ligase n=1 Tax=[Myrmecia] bisecta TaxID=41462 RepID=A0AAW1Q772_9CHLO
MGDTASRRIAVLNSHLVAAERDVASSLQLHDTAASSEAPEEIDYSVALPERLTPTGPWLVHRSAQCPERLISSFPAPDDHIRTLYDNLEVSVSRYANVPFLGQRTVDSKGHAGPYKWMTYGEAGEARTNIGSGLLHLGLAPGATVGLYSINCRDWVLVDAACSAYSLISVPLYDTLGPDAVRYICSHAELAAVACSAEVLPIMLQCLPDCPTVKLVIVYGSQGSKRLPSLPAGVHCKLLGLEDVKAIGREHPRPHTPPAPSDTATLCYTSGTTGVPKGAVLSHGNLIANSAGNFSIIRLQQGDKHISYLPLAHIYERVSLISCLHAGVSIGFYRGNVLELLDDVLELKPTLFASVPRLWNRIHDRVMATIRASNPVSRRLFAAAYASKKAALDRGDPSGGRFGPFWDRLVFSKIRARLGGEVRYMTTGASPISAEVFDFLRICFGATVLEGYGMTETACTIALTHPDDPLSGHVGGPLPSCEIKLDDIPEMGYRNSDSPHPRGEICVRGPIVFHGYFKDEAQSAEVLDAEGWLHTGDVGTWLPGGRLKIIDRKKSLFKLAQGEYVAPEKIENVYQRSALVQQVFVYGDSLRAQLVAVVVPDPEELLPWAAKRSLPADLPALCRDPGVNAAVLKSMQEEGRAAKLSGFEQVAAIHLIPEPFSVENNLLTPTFKLKRPQVQAVFQDAIAVMYARLDK